MFGRNRRTPEELQDNLATKEQELVLFESENERQAAKARIAAKASLRLGDDRGYQKAARRFALAHRQAHVAGGMVEIVRALIDAVNSQRGLEQVVAIGQELERAEKELGYDPERLKRITTHLESGVVSVNQAAVSIASILKAISWGETSQADLDKIHEELLAELEGEATTKHRVKEELHGAKPTPDPAEA